MPAPDPAAAKADATFPRLHRPPADGRDDAPVPPRRRQPIRPGEVPAEDSTRPGWHAERWDGLS